MSEAAVVGNVGELVERFIEIRRYIEEVFMIIEPTNDWGKMHMKSDFISQTHLYNSRERGLDVIARIIISILSMNCDNETIAYERVMRNSEFMVYSFATGGGFIELCLCYVIRRMRPDIRLYLLCCDVNDFNRERINYRELRKRLLECGVYIMETINNFYDYSECPIVESIKRVDIIIAIHITINKISGSIKRSELEDNFKQLILFMLSIIPRIEFTLDNIDGEINMKINMSDVPFFNCIYDENIKMECDTLYDLMLTPLKTYIINVNKYDENVIMYKKNSVLSMIINNIFLNIPNLNIISTFINNRSKIREERSISELLEDNVLFNKRYETRMISDIEDNQYTRILNKYQRYERLTDVDDIFIVKINLISERDIENIKGSSFFRKLITTFKDLYTSSITPEIEPIITGYYEGSSIAASAAASAAAPSAIPETDMTELTEVEKLRRRFLKATETKRQQEEMEKRSKALQFRDALRQVRERYRQQVDKLTQKQDDELIKKQRDAIASVLTRIETLKSQELTHSPSTSTPTASTSAAASSASSASASASAAASAAAALPSTSGTSDETLHFDEEFKQKYMKYKNKYLFLKQSLRNK